MREAWLTIDDSPSPHTAALADFLTERGVPALLFCRGDMMEEFGLGALTRAIERGLVLGNHAWHHYRASEVTLATMIEEIRKTEALIEQAYRQAGVIRKNRYFRFPHLDRGAGGWIFDYNSLDPSIRQEVISIFADGLNIDLTPPTEEQIRKKAELQTFLRAEGFNQFPAEGVSFPWYRETELATACDVTYTFSTSDWMLLDRHRGKWAYRTADDLKIRIDRDLWLNRTDSRHIILAHDKDQIETLLCDLIDHCLSREIIFLPIP